MLGRRALPLGIAAGSAAPGPSPPALPALAALLDDVARRGGLDAVVQFRGPRAERRSSADLVAHARGFARGLARAGVARGARVALLAGNSPEWIEAALGVLEAGAVLVPLDTQMGAESLRHVFLDADAEVLLTETARVPRLTAAGVHLPARVLLLDAAEGEARGWRRLTSDEGPCTPAAPDDPAILFYTSGTTGPPKGVPLTHANLAFQVASLHALHLLEAGEPLLLPLPLHHVYPLVMGMLASLALGYPIVMPAALTGRAILHALREGQVAGVLGVPRFYEALYAAFRSGVRARGAFASAVVLGAARASTWMRRRLGLRLGGRLLRRVRAGVAPRLRLLACGGASLPGDLGRRLEGLGWDVAVGYGLTETSPLIALRAPRQGPVESAGRPLPGVEVRIDAAAGPGEILVRGPGVFRGYRGLPEATARAFTPEGWFRTGDLGHLDRHGCLHVHGRQSTLLVTASGKHVQPEAIESVLEAHPFVREAAVLLEQGQLVALVAPDAAAARAAGRADVEAAVREAVALRSRSLPPYQRAVGVALTNEPLARTRLGKLRRHLLAEHWRRARDAAAGGAPSAAPTLSEDDRLLLEDPRARAVWDHLAARAPSRALSLGDDLHGDLAIDSLEWLSLTMEIQRLAGVELREESIAEIDTLRDLLRHVVDAASEAVSQPARTFETLLERPDEALDAAHRRWLEPLSPLARWASHLITGLVSLAFHIAFRPRVRGAQNLPRVGAFVLAPNHTSFLDPFLMASALPVPLRRRTYWGGWTGIAFRGPVLRALSRLGNLVPVDPERSAGSSLALGAAVLRRDLGLVWFPEGGRSHDGTLQPLRPGLGLLLAHHPVPVIPVWLAGTHEALPMGRALPRLRRLGVVIGAPLDPRALAREGAGSTPAERIVAALEVRLADLARSAEVVALRRGAPGRRAGRAGARGR